MSEHSPAALTRLLTTEEAAAYLNIKPSTLEKWRYTKAVQIPFVKIGTCVRYKTEALNEFLKAASLDSPASAERS